jgi:hypothetical protein
MASNYVYVALWDYPNFLLVRVFEPPMSGYPLLFRLEALSDRSLGRPPAPQSEHLGVLVSKRKPKKSTGFN